LNSIISRDYIPIIFEHHGNPDEKREFNPELQLPQDALVVKNIIHKESKRVIASDGLLEQFNSSYGISSCGGNDNAAAQSYNKSGSEVLQELANHVYPNNLVNGAKALKNGGVVITGDHTSGEFYHKLIISPESWTEGHTAEFSDTLKNIEEKIIGVLQTNAPNHDGYGTDFNEGQNPCALILNYTTNGINQLMSTSTNNNLVRVDGVTPFYEVKPFVTGWDLSKVIVDDLTTASLLYPLMSKAHTKDGHEHGFGNTDEMIIIYQAPVGADHSEQIGRIIEDQITRSPEIAKYVSRPNFMKVTAINSRYGVMQPDAYEVIIS
jgi:hypothetical protein